MRKGGQAEMRPLARVDHRGACIRVLQLNLYPKGHGEPWQKGVRELGGVRHDLMHLLNRSPSPPGAVWRLQHRGYPRGSTPEGIQVGEAACVAWT